MKPTVIAGRCLVLLTVLCAVIAPASASQSQSSPPKWWNSAEYQRELDLLPDQSRRLEEIFQAAIPNQRALKKALDAAEAELEPHLEQGDKKAATEQIARVVAARAALQQSHSLMLLEMRLILTRDQWIKLGVFQRADERARAADKGK